MSRPDLTALGKVIGGGLPVGAFGGRAEIMDQLSPDGPVYQAGTLSGNPIAMAAGLAQISQLIQRGGWSRLEELGAQLRRRNPPRSSRESQLPFIASVQCFASTFAKVLFATSQMPAAATDSVFAVFPRLP